MKHAAKPPNAQATPTCRLDAFDSGCSGRCPERAQEREVGLNDPAFRRYTDDSVTDQQVLADGTLKGLGGPGSMEGGPDPRDGQPIWCARFDPHFRDECGSRGVALVVVKR